MFGATTAKSLEPLDRVAIARYLRTEPLWPLIKAIVRMRRMHQWTFDLVMYIEDPVGEIFRTRPSTPE